MDEAVLTKPWARSVATNLRPGTRRIPAVVEVDGRSLDLRDLPEPEERDLPALLVTGEGGARWHGVQLARSEAPGALVVRSYCARWFSTRSGMRQADYQAALCSNCWPSRQHADAVELGHLVLTDTFRLRGSTMRFGYQFYDLERGVRTAYRGAVQMALPAEISGDLDEFVSAFTRHAQAVELHSVTVDGFADADTLRKQTRAASTRTAFKFVTRLAAQRPNGRRTMAEASALLGWGRHGALDRERKRAQRLAKLKRVAWIVQNVSAPRIDRVVATDPEVLAGRDTPYTDEYARQLIAEARREGLLPATKPRGIRTRPRR